MKKYSYGYFEKKYRILAEKLLQKAGFVDEIKAARVRLGLPEEGFKSTQELANFIISKLSETEKQLLTFQAWLRLDSAKNNVLLTDEDWKEATKAFLKSDQKKGKPAMWLMIAELSWDIETHHRLIVNEVLFEENKYLQKIRKTVQDLMRRFFGFDLLDQHVMFHYIEKYLLMDKTGIDQYIKSKISCPNCKYLGIEHFSPVRTNMDGQDEGPYSKRYIFNERTVKQLSSYFDSVFIIIKPYATKEMVHQYIEDTWNDLKEHIVEKNTFYKQVDVNPTIIKESNDERNRLIYELNKLPKKELLERYKGEKDFRGTGIYKESIISAILEEEYDMAITAAAVKKAASRYAETIKVHNMPKDIRDI